MKRYNFTGYPAIVDASMARLKVKLCCVAIIALSACDGGGSGGDSGAVTTPTPPASTAVFIASDIDTMNGDVELYSVNDDGRDLQRLSPNMVRDGSQVLAFEVSPNGRQVAFSAVLGQNEAVRLFVVPVDGGYPVQVTPEPPRVRGSRPPSVFSFDWSPDSQRLVMAGNLENRNTIAQEIFVVDALGANFQKINGSIGSPPAVEARNPKWSPDGRFIIQEVAHFSEGTGGERFPHALNIFDVDAGMPNSRTLVSTEGSIEGVAWSPTSEYVCFRATDGSRRGGERGIYRSDPRTGQPNLSMLSNPSTATGNSCRWSADGRRVAFHAGPRLNELGLQISTISEGGDAELGPFSAEAREFSWSPDNAERIAFTAPFGDGNALFVWNLATGQADRVSGALPEFADVTAFEWAPNGESLGFIVSSDEEKRQQLFSVVPGNAPVLVSGGIGSDDVVDFAWSPTAERLAFSSKAEDVDLNPVARLSATRVDDTNTTNLLSDMINDVIALGYEGAGEGRVSVSSLFPPPQPPGDTQPETVTINSIAVVGFPATTATGRPWDPFALTEDAKRADLKVDLRLDPVPNERAIIYESNVVNNAFPNVRYVFTERGSDFFPFDLPQTFDFDRRGTIAVIDDDFGRNQIMAIIPYIPVNRRTAFSDAEVVSLSRDGVMIELDVSYD